MPVFVAIVGKSGSGKTTLLVKLIAELKHRGYRVGTVKHAFHGFEFDRPGKDSWRHRRAGADTVMVVAEDGLALIKQTRFESFDAVSGYFDDMDLVLVEGFKQQPLPKIEVVRSARSREPLCCDDPHLLAFVTDLPLKTDRPTFELEDIAALADFIASRVGIQAA